MEATYKTEININASDIQAVKDLAAKYEKYFDKYNANFKRFNVYTDDDNQPFVLIPILYIGLFDEQSYRSTIEVDETTGEIVFDLITPHHIKNEDEMLKFKKGIENFEACKSFYEAFIDELLAFAI